MRGNCAQKAFLGESETKGLGRRRSTPSPQCERVRRRRRGYSMNALRTLIVEDDAMIAGLLAETLEGLGHGVCAVETNVARAVAAASRWHPDLMIVDVGLSKRHCGGQRDPQQ